MSLLKLHVVPCFALALVATSDPVASAQGFSRPHPIGSVPARSATTAVVANTPTANMAADTTEAAEAWSAFLRLFRDRYGAWTNQWRAEDRLAWEDLTNRFRRDHGLALLMKYPQYPPPAQWFLYAVSNPPMYYANYAQAVVAMDHRDWANVRIDTVERRTAETQWAQHLAEVRAAFWASPTVSNAERCRLLDVEVATIARAVDEDLERGAPLRVPLRTVYDKSVAAGVTAATLSKADSASAAGCQQVFGGYSFSQRMRTADPAAFQAYIAAASQSPSPTLRAYAQGQQRLLSLRGQLYVLPSASIDLRQYRGRVVFVDFWSLGCSGCIGALPRYAKLYQKLHARGVEFVSVNLRWPYTSHNARSLAKILADAGVTYPVIQVPLTSEAFEAQYGLQGMPFHLLLDRQGNVVDYGIFSDNELEAALTHLLGDEGATASALNKR